MALPTLKRPFNFIVGLVLFVFALNARSTLNLVLDVVVGALMVLVAFELDPLSIYLNRKLAQAKAIEEANAKVAMDAFQVGLTEVKSDAAKVEDLVKKV